MHPKNSNMTWTHNMIALTPLTFARIAGTASVLLFLILAVVICGCSGNSGASPVSTIEGKVTYKGKLVTGGTLTFEIKTEDGASLPCAGQIDSEGNYKITNALPGKASISVETATQEGLPNYFPLPGKYRDPSKSGLTYDVQPGEQQHEIILK
jgi:hypothetical protein